MAILGPNIGQNSQNSNNWTKIAEWWPIKSLIYDKFYFYFLFYQFWWFLGNFAILGSFYGYFCVFQKKWQNWKNCPKIRKNGPLPKCFFNSKIRIILALWWKFGVVFTVFAPFRAVLGNFRFLISRYREIPRFWVYPIDDTVITSKKMFQIG